MLANAPVVIILQYETYQIKTLHTLKLKKKKRFLLAGLLEESRLPHTWSPASASQSLLEAVVKTQAHYHHPTHAQADADQDYEVHRASFLAHTTPF